MLLPLPREQLFGCIWLPRILAKARLLRAGRLPAAYAARFAAPDGVDQVFLAHFGIAKEDVLAAAEGSEEAISAWFHGLPGMTPARILAWNEIAVNLGRPGYPLEARFPIGMATTYAHLAPLKPQTILEMLEADEREAAGPDR